MESSSNFIDLNFIVFSNDVIYDCAVSCWSRLAAGEREDTTDTFLKSYEVFFFGNWIAAQLFTSFTTSLYFVFVAFRDVCNSA